MEIIKSRALNVVKKILAVKDPSLRGRKICIENNELKITDGRMLFILKLIEEECKNGWYDVIKSTKKETYLEEVDFNCDYPNTRLISDINYTNEFVMTGIPSGQFSASFANQTGVLLDSSMTDAAIKMGVTECFWIDNKTPVKFTGIDFDFFIMPFLN